MADVACVVYDERKQAWFVEWIHWAAKPLGPFTDESAARALAARCNGERSQKTLPVRRD